MKLTREFCAEGCDGIPAAVASGADRVELCVRLDVGGLTPPADVIERAVACCAAPSCGRAPVPVMVLIRPHADSFVYTDRDVQTMCASIHTARHLGAAGVVVGALTASGAIDRAVMETLLDAASGLQVTFHMAFDAIEPFSAQLATELPWLRAQAEQGRLHRLHARKSLPAWRTSRTHRGEFHISEDISSCGRTSLTCAAWRRYYECERCARGRDARRM